MNKYEHARTKRQEADRIEINNAYTDTREQGRTNACVSFLVPNKEQGRTNAPRTHIGGRAHGHAGLCCKRTIYRENAF